MKQQRFWKNLGAVVAMGLLGGCATPPGPHATGGAFLGGATGALLGGAATRHGEGAVIGGVIGALAGALVGHDIDDQTRVRVVQGQPLMVEDVKALAKAGIDDNLIISQINATRTVYHLYSAQIIDLRQSGVSERVIDHMINTPLTVTQQSPRQIHREYYYEPAPYFYRPPPIGFRFYYSRGLRHGG